MIESKVIEALKKRYTDIHPLIFQRSLEHASTVGELFDILEGIPKQYPIFWDEVQKCWIHTNDFTFSKKFFGDLK